MCQIIDIFLDFCFRNVYIIFKYLIIWFLFMRNILLFFLFFIIMSTVSCSSSLEQDFWLSIAGKSITVVMTVDSDTDESAVQEYFFGTFSDDGKTFDTGDDTDLVLRCTEVESMNKATYVMYSGGTSYTFIFDISGDSVEITMITSSISGDFDDVIDILVGTIS